MRIIDISRELFRTPSYPGDTPPSLEFIRTMKDGAQSNTSTLTVSSHGGTHMDAPLHFLEGGGDISSVPLRSGFGPCVVAEAVGEMSGDQMERILQEASFPKRLLLKGHTTLSVEAAQIIAETDAMLIGTEAPSIASPEKTAAVHTELLSAGILVLENLDLTSVFPEGYILCALPLKIRGAEASMVRAVLLTED